MDRVYRVNVRFGRFSAGEKVTIPEDRLHEYADLIDKGWLEEVRTPQGRLVDLEADISLTFGQGIVGGRSKAEWTADAAPDEYGLPDPPAEDE